MDMTKPELHVVQQIRRDKFRVEQMNDFSNTWNHNHHHHHQNIRTSNSLGLIGTFQNQISVPVQTDAYQECTTTFMNNRQDFSNWRSIDLAQPSSVYDQSGIRPSNVGDVFSNHFSSRNQTLDTIAQSSMTSRSEVSCPEVNQKGCVTVLGQNYLQNVVTVACSGSGNENSKRSYDQGSSSGSYRGELVCLPSLRNQSVAHNASQWNHGSSCEKPLNCTATSHTNTKGFSLSLSSDIPKLSPFGDGGNEASLSAVDNRRHFGPLGPFTGYASILKRSRFLEPAQKMLKEFCISYASKNISGSESTSMDNDDSSEMLSWTDRVVDGFNSSSEPLEPKNRLKRAKLLFLLEEVCKRYKLYNHQLQKVVSSFDSVAGLNTATPYISLALKRILRSFNALRTSISEQLKQISSQYSSGSDNNGFQKQQRSLIEPQQHHIWRPQRGLPEHAVTVLRTWLFDHFLHPYPTDSDKMMLATQTGLSRNQVSNWFINARVRLWKPMVEEIHMLETEAIKNADTRYNMEPANRPNIVSSSSHEQTLMDLPGIKRSRLESLCDNDIDRMRLGNVSLTLGLRHGVDNVIQTQTQDHQFGSGGQMFHDFVG